MSDRDTELSRLVWSLAEKLATASEHLTRLAERSASRSASRGAARPAPDPRRPTGRDGDGRP